MPCWFHKQYRKWVLRGFCLAELVRSHWRFSLGVHEFDHLVHWQKETERKGPPVSQPAPSKLTLYIWENKNKKQGIFETKYRKLLFQSLILSVGQNVLWDVWFLCAAKTCCWDDLFLHSAGGSWAFPSETSTGMFSLHPSFCVWVCTKQARLLEAWLHGPKDVFLSSKNLSLLQSL